MKVFLASFVTSVCASEWSWSEFKAVHGRFYNETEEAHRMAVFAKNAELIEKENAKGHDFELGLNAFADLAPEEFVAKYLGFRNLEEARQVPRLGVHTWNGESLSDSVDWVDTGAVTPVKDQKTCGSCWAFSAIGALEGAAQLANGALQQFSEQQLVDCATDFGNAGCRGGLMDLAFQYAENGAALCSEDAYPYEALDGECRASSCDALPAGAVTGHVDVGKHTKDLMSAVAKQPVAVAIEADLPFFQFYKKGVFGGVCGGKLDHGVLAVGYGTWTNGKEYWKVKNSWGSKWGMDGYILLNRDTNAVRRTGTCGILKSASYPVIGGTTVV